MREKTRSKIKVGMLFLLVAIFMAACSGGSMEVRILVSEMPHNDTFKMEPWNVPQIEGARIMAVMPGNTGDVINLTEGFYAAVSPVVSYDGQKMLFSAKKEAADNWQIWEMNLSSLKTDQLTDGEMDCTFPTYLPIDKVGYTKRISTDKFSDCNMVFTANSDGSNQQQVTFSPQTFAALNMLKDGRFLAMEKQVYPQEGKQKLMVLRPDGTKLEFFYKSEVGFVQSKAIETDDEQILFVEKNETGSEIVSLSYNLPLHSHKNITSEIEGEFYSVANYLNGNILTSFRRTEGDSFGLFEYDLKDRELNELYKSEGYDVLEAVLVKAWQRPKNLPSEVQPQEKSGLLMCLDVNFYGIESAINTDKHPVTAEKVEIIGVDSTLGIVELEEDGSFYVKVEADVPFRIQTLSADNELVSGPGSWYYIRPNERRACVGCHTGPEIAPFNRQPVAVRKDPVVIKNNSELKLNTNTKDYEHE